MNVEDPAKMFNEGNWTYSNFAKWVNDTQEKLDEDEFVLQASGYVYFGGMSTAAGIKISNANDYSVNLMEYEQLEFTKMMKELIANGCVSSLDDISFYDKPGASFEKGKVLMTTGNLYQASIYSNIDNFGFVPFPYPDYMDKEDTKIILNDRFSYMYIRGKKYPAISSSIVMTYERVWQIMNELFITTKKNMDKDENFNYENDSYIQLGSQASGRGFWDGFKTVFSKIGEFCSNNFGLILTGLGIFGGYKFCSSSMKTYEENKKNGKLDDKGNLKEKDASIKENVMNFVGHGVHYLFGSNNAEDLDEESDETKKDVIETIEQSNDDNVRKELLKPLILDGQISSLLKTFNSKPEILINVLEVISENITIIGNKHKFKRPENIVIALEQTNSSSDNNIKERAQDVAKELKDSTYFSEAQKQRLSNINNNTKPTNKNNEDDE
ncbi:MAG: hypothetical protein BHW12_05775 [Coprobacillus sp. 28_7]|nr:MAG: hypothetical protein BHW12_05775 [Coprobacillus sp. 28_7]